MKTDKQIQQDVIAELDWQPSVNSAQIGVEVKDGIVTLAGHVSSYGEKWDAERAVQRVTGVKALVVEMDVKLPGTSKRNDADIARIIENLLEWAIYLLANSVKAMVEDGWVILTGEVEWDYQRDSAAASVRYLMGVTGVSDDITVKPLVSLADVKSQIEAALKRGSKADADNISIAIQGTTVTLSGKVNSWAERELARNSAWAAPGVKNVIDNLEVIY
ncbi:BON domain-containing protein [Undibacterium sp. 5I1]|uniref:BON domain-containing protein n=1 Tax=unclassified Undibacterium TaxID=2630295 RepID=UPI002AB34F18|nr:MULTISPECIES: BON domain-containing protein [unclassified Undibacterium]MDY7537844.1 BON domain-containing protein [Undibacterium sp. 5I1]MEB0229961.1 BON domain-containing protein [Undibacterium sp. 10I3]MEB0259131.1 BON domain-containing protein [Undibacterium sp. 5I1]